MRLLKRPRAAIAALLFALSIPLAIGACAEADAQFSVNYAPQFHKGGMTVSVLGVFREGRMSPETWDDIGPRVSTVFGGSLCPTGYDAKLTSTKPDLADAIDEYTRANGVTDDLLEQLAPAAIGDAVLVITVAGRPVNPSHDGGSPAGPTSAPTTPGRGMGRRGAGMGPSPMRVAPIDRNAFEMSASLFSVRDHRAVALVTMGYSGQSGAEALQKFLAKLRESFPGMSCVGWQMDKPIDEKKIREITSE
jgi:hypothetical protein